MNPYPLHKVSYFNLASMSTLEMTSVEIGPYSSSFVCAWYRICGFCLGWLGHFFSLISLGGVCVIVCVCVNGVFFGLWWFAGFFPLVFVCVRFWAPL